MGTARVGHQHTTRTVSHLIRPTQIMTLAADGPAMPLWHRVVGLACLGVLVSMMCWFCLVTLHALATAVASLIGLAVVGGRLAVTTAVAFAVSPWTLRAVGAAGVGWAAWWAWRTLRTLPGLVCDVCRGVRIVRTLRVIARTSVHPHAYAMAGPSPFARLEDRVWRAVNSTYQAAPEEVQTDVLHAFLAPFATPA